ncbi:MAG TPA: thiamine pyrophosphate-dependent enzyme [Beijerinckiaceae bacterium]|nr:thiamine pyrophosphate-dependent enzyme [Beijerinckiaceae bacterium]
MTAHPGKPELRAAAALERPAPSQGNTLWASDVAAEVLRTLDIPFVALNPGASFRGLHDSLVNHTGNAAPQMLLCLHEEHAVAIAHGWAKVTERPMAAIVHSNVGLMHASMAVFNAWCDRVPLLLLGATGPVDATRRRPWIDWIHTAKDQAALVRHYVKWDDQPASVGALVEALLRSHQIARTAPCGPTYVCLDAALQESQIDAVPAMPSLERFKAPRRAAPDADLLTAAADLLAGARRPLILAGRVGRGTDAWEARIRLAEAAGALVLTDLKTAAAFPTAHGLHAAPAGTFATPQALDVLRQADVVLSLDWIDLAGTLKAAFGESPPPSKIIHVSVDMHVHNGWSMDHQSLPPVDIHFLNEPDAVTAGLLAALGGAAKTISSEWLGARRDGPQVADAPDPHGQITIPEIAHDVRRALRGHDACLIRGPFSWAGHLWPIEHPLDYLGIDGGAGLGSGPGIAVGAALALRDSGRIALSIFGDGDFMMGCQAIWTAAHYRVPLIVIVSNNQSFFNDELHQERMAKQRGRLVENKWIGQRIADPDIDIAMLARAQGAVGLGPVTSHDELRVALDEAVARYRDGRVVVVDVRVQPGYDPNTTRLTTSEGLAGPGGDRGGSRGGTGKDR